MALSDYFTQTLKENEAVVAIVRKHWITLVFPVLIALVGVGLLIGFVDVFFQTPFGSITWLVLLVVIVTFSAYRWVVHYFDSFIITDLRIIDIDQTGLFKRTVSETTFDKVQDVTYSIVGFAATAFDYGTVSVQTAAAQQRIELDHVPGPRQVQEVIVEAQQLFRKRHGGEMSAQQLIELIAKSRGAGLNGPEGPLPAGDEPLEEGTDGGAEDGAEAEE